MRVQRSRGTAALCLLTAVMPCGLLLMACSTSRPVSTVQPAPRASQLAQAPSMVLSTPADGWQALFQKTPFPYTTPLPPPASTLLDGTYVAQDPIQGTRVPCRRCPPYPPEGGTWKLSLDRGIYRLIHPDTGWHTLGSYAVDEGVLTLFNDPHCYDLVGTYTWELLEGGLQLKLVEDGCGRHLRAERFTKLTWQGCQPPSLEAAVTNHWPSPPGCDADAPD
jgi:hypothetical protein